MGIKGVPDPYCSVGKICSSIGKFSLNLNTFYATTPKPRLYHAHFEGKFDALTTPLKKQTNIDFTTPLVKFIDDLPFRFRNMDCR